MARAELGGTAAAARFTRGTDFGVTVAGTAAKLARLTNCSTESFGFDFSDDIRDWRDLHSPCMRCSIN